jgi:hypothetical protein
MPNDSDISAVAVHELFSDPAGPVGGLMDELAWSGAQLARSMAPRDSGRMMSSVTSGTSRNPADGTVQGWFGAGALADPPEGSTWKGGFPYLNALEARHHYTWNRSPAGQKHTRGVRRTHPFLTRAIDFLSVG